MNATELSCDDPEPPSSNLNLLLDVDGDVDNAMIPSSDSISTWVRHAVTGVPGFDSTVVYEVSVSVVTEPQMQTLNRNYRDKNSPTNVLSFPSNMPTLPASENSASHLALGDVVLCHSVIVSEAEAQKKTVAEHWAHMIVHSVLHLFDYDHEQDAAAESMEALEVTLLEGLSIPNPYQRSFESE